MHPLDDPSIPDSETLWRRVPVSWIVPDQRNGGTRLSSQAFEGSSDGSGCSVLLSSQAKLEDVFARHPGMGIAALQALYPRQIGLGVRRVPIPDEPAHAQIEGNFTHSTKKRLAAAATILVSPT